MTGFRGILLSLFLYISLFLFLQIHHISAQTYLGYSCNTDNSTPAFKANLNTIGYSFTNLTPYGSYYQGTAGEGADKVNAIAFCRGDVDTSDLCQKCVKEAVNSLTTTNCPNKIEAITWYDECQFRYSNKPIFGIMSLNPAYLLESTNDASNVTLFSQELRSLAGSLVGPASTGYSRKFAALKSSNAEIYGVMQCDPDITTGDCKSCLNSIANDLSACCYNRVGARWITPSCSFRYEIYPFLKTSSNQESLPPQ